MTESLALVRRPRRVRVPGALRTPLGVSGVLIVIAWLMLGVFAGALSPAGPLDQDFARLEAPNGAHLFGTDSVGRDVWSRVVHAAPASVLLAVSVVVGSMLIGVTLGALAGYLGRVVDEVIMRITDLVFAFPTIILAMIIAASLGPSLFNAVIALLIVSWPPYARVTRSLVLAEKQQEYVLSARLLGSGPLTSLVRDVMPNVVSPILILGTLNLGTATMELAGLSFLGLGATPPTPDWGAMVADGMRHITSWWIALPAGLAIVTLVMAFNFIGDALRDSLDRSSNGVSP